VGRFHSLQEKKNQLNKPCWCCIRIFVCTVLISYIRTKINKFQELLLHKSHFCSADDGALTVGRSPSQQLVKTSPFPST
jgi:hypothetical protein